MEPEGGVLQVLKGVIVHHVWNYFSGGQVVHSCIICLMTNTFRYEILGPRSEAYRFTV